MFLHGSPMDVVARCRWREVFYSTMTNSRYLDTSVPLAFLGFSIIPTLHEKTREDSTWSYNFFILSINNISIHSSNYWDMVSLNHIYVFNILKNVFMIATFPIFFLCVHDVQYCFLFVLYFMLKAIHFYQNLKIRNPLSPEFVAVASVCWFSDMPGQIL